MEVEEEVLQTLRSKSFWMSLCSWLTSHFLLAPGVIVPYYTQYGPQQRSSPRGLSLLCPQQR